ncbi:MAG: hypothetical protein CL424_17885 [Acidimicrobiaceae bacterium]|nr:hypothetical protein [Acidimicrobiaceae bacterium]
MAATDTGSDRFTVPVHGHDEANPGPAHPCARRRRSNGGRSLRTRSDVADPGGGASVTGVTAGARLIEATHPDGINVGIGFLVNGVAIDVVWASADQVAFDLLDVDAIAGLTPEQMIHIGDLVALGANTFGDEFTGVRLVPLDRFANTRLAAPEMSSPLVTWSITELPAWLEVRS